MAHKQNHLFPDTQDVDTTSQPRTDADALYGDLIRLQDADPDHIVGLARHEPRSPIVEHALGHVAEVAALGAEGAKEPARIAPQEAWDKFYKQK